MALGHLMDTFRVVACRNWGHPGDLVELLNDPGPELGVGVVPRRHPELEDGSEWQRHVEQRPRVEAVVVDRGARDSCVRPASERHQASAVRQTGSRGYCRACSVAASAKSPTRPRIQARHALTAAHHCAASGWSRRPPTSAISSALCCAASRGPAEPSIQSWPLRANH